MDRPSFPRPDGLSPDQATLAQLPLRIPPGFGMRVLPERERQIYLTDLGDSPGPTNVLQVWEPPRKGHLYVVSADISSGMGLDNSVVEVTRVGTVREIEEQVAQFVTNSIDETDLAAIIDAIGRLYCGKDGQPALVAIECNGMGIATQSHLAKSIGYTNLYIWRYLDAVEGKDLTTRYGWYTNQRTRPLILQYYHHAIKTVDPFTGLPDYRINSPHTLAEMSAFQSAGALWMAEAVDGAHDDCIMAGAIGVFVAQTLQYDQRETSSESRRRLSAEAARAEHNAALTKQQVSFQTTDASYDEMVGRDEDDIEGGYKVPHYL